MLIFFGWAVIFVLFLCLFLSNAWKNETKTKKSYFASHLIFHRFYRLTVVISVDKGDYPENVQILLSVP